MDINQSYREAVKTIKEAILRSQYRAAGQKTKTHDQRKDQCKCSFH